MQSTLVESFPLALQALGLSMARAVGCVVFIPAFGRRHMTILHRNAVSLAIALPQCHVLWHSLQSRSTTALPVIVLAFKESLIGCILGLMLAIPFWSFQSACTLVDNQRGANTAQQTNPSLHADASILGELAERALIAFLFEAGVFAFFSDLLASSYGLWPALSPLPELSPHARAGVMAACVQLLADAILYSGPVILLLLAIEAALALASATIQGLDAYQTAMPVKSLMALMMLALSFGAMLMNARGSIESWWLDGVLSTLRQGDPG
jgi:type III secretion protein T